MDDLRETVPPVVLPRPLVEGRLAVDTWVLVDGLAAMAGAAGAEAVAAAALRPLRRLPGVRAALVARALRPGGDPVVVASSGYDCPTMAAGASLPLDAGLPLTETVRRGTTRVVGAGPSWVCVPAGPGGGLLLSLTGPPPDDMGVAMLERLGRSLGAALARAGSDAGTRHDLAVLESGLVHPTAAADGLVVSSVPVAGPLSGDVVELVRDDDVRWLLVADVCGSGARAAVGAERLRAAFRACAPGSAGPAALLARLDRAFGGGEEEFATALVVRVEGHRVCTASAGHPPPLLLPGGRLALVPGPPLGLGVDGPFPRVGDASAVLPPDGLLLVATDGLVDRGSEVDLDAVVAALAPGLPAATVLGRVVAACCAAGRAQDDATLVVLSA